MPVLKIPGTNQGNVVTPEPVRNPIYNFPFNIVPGMLGTEQMDFTPSVIVVSNPYNYYIYFPDATQWVPPYTYNFMFPFAPSAPNTIRWDSTKDIYGNIQYPNAKLIAVGNGTNDASRYGSTLTYMPPPQFTLSIAMGFSAPPATQEAIMLAGTPGVSIHMQTLVMNCSAQGFVLLRWGTVSQPTSQAFSSYWLSNSASPIRFGYSGYTIPPGQCIWLTSGVGVATEFYGVLTYDLY